ncbi:triphosphoribosyl-dephospho-CoA synthase MdcB [Legionella oakridgensis]|uniref:triphosphoribosyl-dephospho-CoA synthase n=2 Tax=Legionella oakridgensis TaxID=29423 RepID=W0BFW1_9GAMM|nr:triphosphoribosyl-dephospho-CoA synthase MdcB [Legionella oakridgensis]AHE67591.1 triphosphoribosyl-dephospho-CoA synthetase [Legionella oakridgensis ATCC 33761 = DSM 21215]ETO92831.1 triphosphoribosyl-dephospho-CoA synthetase [Legionella oakridgensis RV-2-2007]KTD37062.1 2(5'-triphosphoribosyl)-3'-dephosphocoenzyme A synthase CitG [Legionella oakridgensis]STY20629.1 triphosphoribosyl-dephospho-CoA synthase [Legionella longbeachae]
MQIFQHCLPDASKIARYYAKIAVRALYDEVSLYPKPGLVSFVDSGAHRDMNGELFFRSLFGLRHYFLKVAFHSAQGEPLQNLVKLGLDAETRMHAITCGINTHRGAIFALGIVCATISRLSSQKTRFSTIDLQQAIVEDWAPYLQEVHRIENTHGALVKKKYNVPDARDMAIRGYEPVFNAFHELADMRLTDKTFLGLLAYKKLLLSIDDINILYRTGPNGLAYARYHIQKAIVLNDRETSILKATKLHRLFSRNNISPGGVADLLGLVYFLQHVFSGYIS